MLQNGSFSEGWETLPAIADAGFLRNQRPNGWQIEWQRNLENCSVARVVWFTWGNLLVC